MCDHCHFAEIFSLQFFFYPQSSIKSRPHKNGFFVTLTQCPLNSEFFLGYHGFAKSISPVRDHCCRLGDELHPFLTSFCRNKQTKMHRRLSTNSCLIGVWCCCMCYAAQILTFPCMKCDFHVKSHATRYWEFAPLHSCSRHTPWCLCGSGCWCCAGGTGSSC